jgi:hypothetical protein
MLGGEHLEMVDAKSEKQSQQTEKPVSEDGGGISEQLRLALCSTRAERAMMMGDQPSQAEDAFGVGVGVAATYTLLQIWRGRRWAR